MRWFVDLTPLGGGATEMLCLEAADWQHALRSARELKGHDAPVGALSVEVLDDGYRAVDPTVRVAFLVRRAPEDAPLADGAPARKRSSRQSLGGGASAPSDGDAEPTAPLPGRVAVAPAPVPPTVPRPTPLAVTPLLPHEVLSSRTVEPTPAQPIRYFEVALVLSEGGIEVARTALEALLRARLDATLTELGGAAGDAPGDAAPGVYVNVAVFGRAPSGKPMRRPLATLAFKDWAGEAVVEHFEVPMSTPTPSAPVLELSPSARPSEAEAVTLRRPTPAPEAARPLPDVAPPAALPPTPKPTSVPPPRQASGPPPALPASAFAPIVPPAAPLPSGTEPSAQLPADLEEDERDTDLKERDTEISTQLSPQSDGARSVEPVAPPPAVIATAPPSVDDDLVATQQRPRVNVGAYLATLKTEDLPPTRLTEDAAAPAAPPVPLASVAPPIAAGPSAGPARAPSVPPTGDAADLAVLPPELVAARQPPPPAPPAPTRPSELEPTPSADLASGNTPTPLFDRREKPEPATKLAGARRFSGDELISELFDACGELAFMPTIGEALDYVVSILLEKLPCEVLLLSLYDIDKNEFVVVRQAGGRSVVQERWKAGATVRSCMKTSRVAVVAHSLEVGSETRWQSLGIPPRSLLLAPVEAGRRDMGLIELANPHDGKPLDAADGNALKYLGAQLGEFLAERGVSLDDDSLFTEPEPIPSAVKQQVAAKAKTQGKTGAGRTGAGKASPGKTSGGSPGGSAKRKR